MTNKIVPGQRGRPRSFDEAEVLRRAQKVFLEQGFEATSYEDIALAMGLSKPSLYNTFGDKTALFERSITDYVDHAREQIMASFTTAPNLAEAAKPSTGCLQVGTALPGCAQNEQLRNALSGFIASLDADLEKLIAERFGADVRALGKTARELSLLISGLLFSLAVRARTGVTRRKLRKAALELAVILT